MKFRPAAIPLITVDPFFSIWSCNDALYSSPTEHWSGRPCPIVAGVFIDGQFHSVSGFDADGAGNLAAHVGINLVKHQQRCIIL